MKTHLAGVVCTCSEILQSVRVMCLIETEILGGHQQTYSDLTDKHLFYFNYLFNLHFITNIAQMYSLLTKTHWFNACVIS